MNADNKEAKEEFNKEELINEETEKEEINNEAAALENDEGAEAESDELTAVKAELEVLKDKLMRHAAEFDNYKKRTQKEKEEMYKLAVSETVEKLLPVKDNLGRAVSSVAEADEKVAEGVKMIDKQFSDVLKDIGVEEIESVGSEFDPEKHNAVMHEENDELGENVITEEFMKGYIYKERVIRHSVVKVAN